MHRFVLYLCYFTLWWTPLSFATPLTVQSLEMSIPAVTHVTPMKQVKASLMIHNTSDHTIKDVKVQLKTQHPGFELQQPRLFVKRMEPGASYQHIFTIDETNAQFARGVHCGLDDLYISVRRALCRKKCCK